MRHAIRCSFVALLSSALLAATAAFARADEPAPAESAAPAPAASAAPVTSPAASEAPAAPAPAPAAATPAPSPTAAITVPQPGTHGLTAQLWNYGFGGFCCNSPTLLGPWDIQSLQYQWATGNDIPSVTALLRQDHDIFPTASQAWYADDYHTFAPNFYTYAQIGYSAGHVLPNSTYYLEGDAKFGKLYNYVLGFGFGTANNPSGAFFPFQSATTTQYFSVGPSVYTGPFAFTLRFLPTDTNGTKNASTEFTAQYTNVGHDQTVFTLQDGSQPNVFVGTPKFGPIYQYQHYTVYEVTEKHWLTRTFGFLVGGLLGYYNGGQTALNTYNQSAITYGLFWYPGP